MKYAQLIKRLPLLALFFAFAMLRGQETAQLMEGNILKPINETKDFQCGDIFTDPRDGQEYPTVQIGSQCWMAKNLNYGTRINQNTNMADNGIVEKYCYDDDENNCDVYGAHYSWKEMMNYSVLESYKGICPEGWHIPSDAEWCTLEQSVDPTISCDAIFWRGVDGGTKLKSGGSSGFEALMAGQVFTFSSQLEEFTYFWTSTPYSDVWSYYRKLGVTNPGVTRWYTSNNYGYSVRCVQGEGAINQPPAVPSNPIPPNDALNQNLGIALVWECEDPENDVLTFDVYFGTDPEPPLLQAGVAGITYTPYVLQHATKYYWKIIAHDSQGNTTEGPVWNFRTKNQEGAFQCGDVFLDQRDGKLYTTVQIGDQCWMSQNLNYGEQINGSVQMTDNGVAEKYCYDNDPANCNTFGGLYQWDEMMNYNSQQGMQGICPDGWRLPTDNEWKELEGIADSEYPVGDPEWDEWSWRGSDVGGNLKQVGTTYWESPNAGATNSTGFTALPGGYGGSSFSGKGTFGFFWTSTQFSGSSGISRLLHKSLTSVSRDDYSKTIGMSVRCVKGADAANEPPATPSNPNPANGESLVPIQKTLSWTCTDPDGDPLTYDVYFGTNENPPLAAEDISTNSYSPGTLDYKTTYYWKIVAHDDQGNTTEGPVWNFMTTPLFFTVTFTVEDQSGNPLSNAVITLDGVTNPANNYVFDAVEAGTYDYAVVLENYVPTYGEVTVVDQNIGVTVTLPGLVTINEFPFTEDFSGGDLPAGWLNMITGGEYSWEFALNPFPHTFIHNIGRPAVHARLITPLLDAGQLGQVTLGINQRFMVEPSGGTASILISEDGNNWQVIHEYMASIGSGDEFEYTEFNINTSAAGKQVWIALSADFPDTDANYEAVWEVESLTVFEPNYSVTFTIEDINGNAINDAVITLDEIANPAGEYVFESISAGTYLYIVSAPGFIDRYGFVTLEDQNISESVIMNEELVIGEFPYVQDFEEGILPEGWNNIILGDTAGYWRFSEQQAQIMSNYGERTHSLLVSPVFDCSDLEAVALGLNHYYMDIYGIGFAQIVVSTDGDNWTPVETFQNETVGSNDFPYFEYYLTDYAASQEKVLIGLLYDDLAETEFWWLVDAFTVFEPIPYDVSVENLSGNKYVPEGDSFVYAFKMVNRGSENDTYNLEVLNATWDFDLLQETISLDAGQSDTVYVEVFVPAGLEMGDTNDMVLKAASQGDPDIITQDDFTTIAVSTIKSYYFEDFDFAEVPALPGGWNKIQQSSAYWARVQTQESMGIAPVSVPNNIEMYNSSDINANLILISPMIDESVDLKDFRVLFKLRTGTSSGVAVGTMDSPTGTFTERATFSSPEHFNWIYCMHAFDDYQGSDRYIAFKMTFTDTNRGSYIDDVTIEIIPPPILTATPESHDFGEYWMNYPSEVPLALDLRNTGHDSLIINSISLNNPDDFIIDIKATIPAELYWNQFVPVDVYINASVEGPVSSDIVIEYNDGTAKTMMIPLEGIGLPRPPGSTCDDPIYLELPVVDYENTTEFAGNDYNNFMVYPWAGLMNGYDMDFRFTLEEESYLAASISGPYYGPSLYILDRCPDADNPAPLYAWIEKAYGGSFEDVILPAGEYHLVVSSPAAANPYTYYTPFVLNLTAEPTPNLYEVTFNLLEDSPEQAPVADAEISITGFQTELKLNTNIFGQVKQNLYEYEYQVFIYKKDYETIEFTFNPVSDTIVDIAMNDIIWTPHSLSVETEDYLPGQAFFDWIAKPQGEPWEESFELDYPPVGWDTIVFNNGQVEEPGYDWKFTWQKYGTVYFSNLTVEPVEGDFQAFVHWSTDPQDEWLISKEFEAPAGNLVFWYNGLNGSNYSDYYVKVSNDGGETWFELWNASDLPNGRNNYDFPVILDLQPWAGQNIRVAWHAYSPLYGLEGAWCIDKISAGEMKINLEDLMHVSKSEKPADYSFSGTIPSTRDGADLPRVTFEDMNYNFATTTRSNEGFSIYLDDMENPIVTGIEASEYMFNGLEPGDYVAGVQAVYSTGQSEIVTIPFNNPVGGQTYNVTFSVKNQDGQNISGAEILVYYGGQVVKTLQTFNGSVITQLFSGDYEFTVFKDNYKTFSGEFAVALVPQTVNVVLEVGYQLTFAVSATGGQPIANATIFCNGEAKTTAANGTAVFELDAGNYAYAVTHPLFDRVLSSVTMQTSTTENVTMKDLSCPEPENLTAQLEANDVVLNWDTPNATANGVWLNWDRQHGNNSIGTGGPFDVTVAQRFDINDLQQYDEKYLTRIYFVPREELCEYSVRVWTGGSLSGPETMVVDQPVVDPVIGEWNEIFLLTPVPVDRTKELWIGFRSNTQTGYPSGVDVGPATNEKGNMILMPGSNWQTLLQVNPNLNYNWSVRGFAEDADVRYPYPEPIAENNSGKFTGQLKVTNNEPDRNLYNPRILLGYDVYRNDEKINFNTIGTNSFIDINPISGNADYNVTSVWNNDCESDYSNTASIFYACQQYQFAQGWNSISGFVVPSDPAVVSMFAPLQNNLVVMQNLEALYWPSQGLNTIVNFDNTSGYAIKLTENASFDYCGDAFAATTIQLDAGWNYLPVLSSCDVDAMMLFEGIIDDIVYVQDLIGTQVFWPVMGIYTLEKLIPGRAYKIKALNTVAITFPECGQATTTKAALNNVTETPWGSFQASPQSQAVVFLPSATDNFRAGDVIGAFGADDKVFGYAEFQKDKEVLMMVLFGNDNTSAIATGFAENETVSYRLYRPETGETFDLSVEYSQSLDNTSGRYQSGSYAAITKTAMNVTGVESLSASAIAMYPNPARESVNFSFSGNENEIIHIEILDVEGRLVAAEQFSGATRINTADFRAGIYFVKISTRSATEIRKLVIR
jgi:uncharacterized protein (TIGR02145 family)